MGSSIPLHHLSIGSSGQVRKLTANGSTRRRMLDLGLIQGTRWASKSPSGDPIAYELG